MKTLNLKSILLATLTMFGFAVAQAQTPKIANMRPVGQEGLNVFEAPKTDSVEFDGVKVRIGGDFAIQFQGLNQYNDAESTDPNALIELGDNFNLPTANLNLDVQLAEGLRMHMRTYLSARHHNEAWVKGGYIQIDNLDFIKEGFASQIMDVAQVRIGLDEINYGDAHFRRSDNGMAIYNPFVGNYIMDAFTTEAFGEVNILLPNGFVGVLGLSNGKLNQSVVVNDNTDNQVSLYGKLGYDKQLNDDLRVRLTGSFYRNNGLSTGSYLYGGDRAGSRYYNVLHTAEGGSNFEPRFNPRFKQLTAVQINPFIKYEGLEFFGIYEVASNGEDEGDGQFTQIAGELIYRFGANDNFYLGGRYNTVKGNAKSDTPDLQIDRYNIGGGWFLTNNVLAKLEYVNQTYEGSGWENKYLGAGFNGVVLEAVISF